MDEDSLSIIEEEMEQLEVSTGEMRMMMVWLFLMMMDGVQSLL